MKKTCLIYFTLAALMLAVPAEGQILKETKTEAIKIAAMAGEIAGGGYYCKLDEDDLDDFITMAHARIANEAIDKVDRVVAQLEFSNNYSAWSARAPKGGCEAFLTSFSRKFADLINKNKKRAPEGP
jgi:hypothetical protein